MPSPVPHVDDRAESAHRRENLVEPLHGSHVRLGQVPDVRMPVPSRVGCSVPVIVNESLRPCATMTS